MVFFNFCFVSHRSVFLVSENSVLYLLRGDSTDVIKDADTCLHVIVRVQMKEGCTCVKGLHLK